MQFKNRLHVSKEIGVAMGQLLCTGNPPVPASAIIIIIIIIITLFFFPFSFVLFGFCDNV